MPIPEGTCIGNINVEVYQTANSETFFWLQGTDKKVIPIIDYLETSLENYKR